MIEQLINKISILFRCYEQLLLLRKYMIKNPKTCNDPHWIFLHNVIYDHSVLIVNALFRKEKKEERDKIHYLNLLNKNGGLGKLVKKIAVDEPALTALIKNKSGIEIGDTENLTRYRHDIGCHKVDYNPEERVIYFPKLFDFVKNAKALVSIINDIYNERHAAPNFKKWPATFDDDVKNIKQQFINIEKLYNDTTNMVASSNAKGDLSPYDVRSRLLARQEEIVGGIVLGYGLFFALQTFPESELIKIWKRAVYSELVLKIWILFGEEDNNNKLTHFYRSLEEYEKFCNENAVHLQQVKKAFSRWVDLKKLRELIGDTQRNLKGDRHCIAHVDIKNLNYQDDLIKECAEICCELWSFIEIFRCRSHKLSPNNVNGIGYNRVGIINSIRCDFGKALIQFFSMKQISDDELFHPPTPAAFLSPQ